jgi:hypothetical protein
MVPRKASDMTVMNRLRYTLRHSKQYWFAHGHAAVNTMTLIAADGIAAAGSMRHL